MTPATLHFLRSVLDRVTLQVSDPNFARDALAIITAIEELDNAINAPSPTLHDVNVP